MSGSIPLLATLFVSVVGGTAAAILAWREGHKPGARPLVLMLTGQIWWSISLLFRLQASGATAKLWWYVMWIGVVSIPLGWLLFALEYTGRKKYLNRRYLAGYLVIPVITVILVVFGPNHELLVVSVEGINETGVLQTVPGGLWFWVVTIYTYVLGGAGIVLLLNLIVSQTSIFRKQATALIIGLLVPWVTNALYLTDVLQTGIDPTPIAFSVSGIGFLLALRRFQLLETSPAPNKQARKLVFDGVQEGTVIVDTAGHVVDINEQALDVFNTERKAILGSEAGETIPNFETLPESGTLDNYLTVETESERRNYEVEVTPITSGGGRTIGRLITFNDITDFLRQQQRLEVLHRVLRHNIRTETNLILGYAEAMDEARADIVRERAIRIEEFGQKGRDAIELFRKARGRTESRNLGTMLEGCLDSIEAEHRSVNIEYDGPEKNVFVEGLLVSVFENAIQNAILHNENDHPTVSVRTTVKSEIVQVEIVDNGPGISEYELSVLSDGVESPLEHGSGLGLWIIKWGVDLVGGTVEFCTECDQGTTVRIDVPIIESN